MNQNLNYLFVYCTFVPAEKSLNAQPSPMRTVVCHATTINMKINKTIFWTFSIVISLLSCYLFQLSSVQLYGDGNYMQSLNLPSDADTPAVAIAGTVLLSIGAAIGHIILLGIFLIIAFLRHEEIEISSSDFVVNIRKSRLTKTIFQIIGFLLTGYWLWDFFDITRIKFFPNLFLFTLVAIAVTWTYVLWLINLTKSLKEPRSTNTQQKVPMYLKVEELIW